MTYARGDIVQSRRKDLEIDRAENGRVECLAVEIMLRCEKWIVVNLYKQPIMSTEVFLESLERLYSTCSKESCYYGVFEHQYA